jgi:hypothetical protein
MKIWLYSYEEHKLSYEDVQMILLLTLKEEEFTRKVIRVVIVELSRIGKKIIALLYEHIMLV